MIKGFTYLNSLLLIQQSTLDVPCCYSKACRMFLCLNCMIPSDFRSVFKGFNRVPNDLTLYFQFFDFFNFLSFALPDDSTLILEDSFFNRFG